VSAIEEKICSFQIFMLYNKTLYKGLLNMKQEQIIIPELPLAVYREMAAHLRQIEGIKVAIIEYDLSEGVFEPNSVSAAQLQAAKQEFSYRQSQVRGLSLEYAEDLDDRSQQLRQQIITYYDDRYGKQ
jgi:NACalpha-BTF3-like transcription factor